MRVKDILLFPFRLVMTILTILAVGSLLVLTFPLFVVRGMMNGSAEEGVDDWIEIVIYQYNWIIGTWF